VEQKKIDGLRQTRLALFPEAFNKKFIQAFFLLL